MAKLTVPNLWEAEAYCSRCGEFYRGAYCRHVNTADVNITDAEAERIRARYALGKLHNPDHDTTSYRDAK